MTLTKFESDLFRLAFLEGSFYYLHQEFPKIKKGDTLFSFKDVVRELVIIKLLRGYGVSINIKNNKIILKNSSHDITGKQEKEEWFVTKIP